MVFHTTAPSWQLCTAPIYRLDLPGALVSFYPEQQIFHSLGPAALQCWVAQVTVEDGV